MQAIPPGGEPGAPIPTAEPPLALSFATVLLAQETQRTSALVSLNWILKRAGDTLRRENPTSPRGDHFKKCLGPVDSKHSPSRL